MAFHFSVHKLQRRGQDYGIVAELAIASTYQTPERIHQWATGRMALIIVSSAFAINTPLERSIGAPILCTICGGW